MVVVRDGARYDAGRATVAAWLCGIARNFVRQRLERDRRLTSVDFADDGEPSAVDNGAVDPLAGLLRAERDRDRCAARCRRCPCRTGRPWCCATCRSMSYGDAAAALGCPVGTVRSRLHRARTMLAARLAVSAPSRAASAAGARAGPPALEAGWAGQVGATNTGRG